MLSSILCNRAVKKGLAHSLVELNSTIVSLNLSEIYHNPIGFARIFLGTQELEEPLSSRIRLRYLPYSLLF